MAQLLQLSQLRTDDSLPGLISLNLICLFNSVAYVCVGSMEAASLSAQRQSTCTGIYTMNSAAAPASIEPITDVPFIDRRQQPGQGERGERRQFGNSYHNLSPEGQQLAEAIDTYKVDHHRRYITTDELIGVLGRLGYRQTLPPKT